MTSTTNTPTTLTDRSTAFDLLKDSKFGIQTMSRLAAEATDPQLRQFISRHLPACLQEHFQLADLAVENGWYNPLNIAQQLQSDVQQAEELTAQNFVGQQFQQG